MRQVVTILCLAFASASAYAANLGGISTAPYWRIDANTITGIADGNLVAIWSPCIGTGDANQQTGSKMPTYRANVGGTPAVDFNGSNGMVAPVDMSDANQAITVIAVVKCRKAYTFWFNDSANGLYLGSGKDGEFRYNAISAVAGASQWNIQHFAYDGTNRSIGHGHNILRSATAVTISMGPFISIGSMYASLPSFAWDGYIKDVVIYKAGLSDADIRAVLAELYSYHRLDRLPLVVCDGDSITGTTGLLGPSWPFIFGLRQTNEIQLENVAFSGQYLTTGMMSDANTQVDPLYDGNRPSNVYIAFGGTNDIYAGEAVAATAYSRLVGLLLGRKQAGFTNITATCLPRGTVVALEANRIAFNALIRATPDPNYYSVLADLALNGSMGLPNCQADTTYYNADKIHPAPAGSGVLGTIFADAYYRLFNYTSPALSTVQKDSNWVFNGVNKIGTNRLAHPTVVLSGWRYGSSDANVGTLVATDPNVVEQSYTTPALTYTVVNGTPMTGDPNYQKVSVTPGSLVIPPPAETKSGTKYGIGGDANTGTYSGTGSGSGTAGTHDF